MQSDPLMLIPVIMAGGTGSRLWPLSREHFPKQFIALTGEQSLLQNTASRAGRLPAICPPVIVCGEGQRFLVDVQLKASGIHNATILIEPSSRNTAPAVACAARYAIKHCAADALVLLMAADHVIEDEAAFAAAVAAAIPAANSGRIVTFGIKPTRAETGYGYIRIGEARSDGSYAVDQFVEKPDLERAEQFLEQGGYCWNGGMFLFRADVMLDELKRLQPELAAHAEAAFQQAATDLHFVRLDEEHFSACADISIDHAVMEKTDKAVVVLMDAGWDDVGAWTFLDHHPKDTNGNGVRGDVVLNSARNNLVHAESRLVALAGVEDTIVIETKDAILVTTRAHAQDIKKLVVQLKRQGRSEAVQHATVHRPWGRYETVAIEPRFQVKRIVVSPGEKLSLQMHHHRAEHWIVVSGTAKVTRNGEEFLLTENESTYIPLGAKHRLENPGKLPLELIEVQSGPYLGEDDIVRFDDIYGRSPELKVLTTPLLEAVA